MTPTDLTSLETSTTPISSVCILGMSKCTIKLINADFFTNDIPDKSIDLILTDPPYNCLSSVLPFDQPLDLKRLTGEFNRILAPHGQIVIFCNFELAIRLYIAFKRNFDFRYNFVWHKTCATPINLMRPLNDHELILVFKKWHARASDLTFNAEDVANVGRPYVKRSNILINPTRKTPKKPVSVNESGRRFPRSVLKNPSKPNMTKQERTSHPTQKPVFLLSYLIKLLSNEGDMVCDPFAGSGSTLVACNQYGRSGLGYEIDKTYYKEACKRLKRVTAQAKLW